MRVFLTGATGFIGTAIAQELLTAGHTVLGLARSDAAADTLTRAGVRVQRGELADTDGLAAAARACDGVIHTAYVHDFTAYAAAAETDQRAVTAMLAALAGSDKPFVLTSATAVLARGQLGSEADPPAAGAAGGLRAASEQLAQSAAQRGVRASVVRLPPTVHGAGDHGFVPMLIACARRHGHAAYVGDGENRWPAVHRLDAARLYRLALERAAAGARLHAVAEQGVPMRDIAAAIGRGLGLPTRSLTADEGPAYFDFLARFAGFDNPTSSAVTRSSLGWDPQGPQLLEDMRDSGYF